MTWELPAEACTQAGSIEISITIYDKQDVENGHVVFSWNTSNYTGLSIGQSMATIGTDFPPKDEILMIDSDTKNIIAPVGYNNIVGYYGEIGVSEVNFLINRYVGKKKEIDVMNENTHIRIYVIMAGYMGSDSTETHPGNFKLREYTVESRETNDGLVLLTWKLPAGITNGPGKATNFEITVSFYQTEIVGGIEVDTVRWFSNVYSNLRIGDSVLSAPINPEPGTDWDIFEDIVVQAISQYFTNPNNNFVINANADHPEITE